MPSIVVYTAVVGRPDVLLDPTPVLPGIDLICYTDLQFHGISRYRMASVYCGGGTARRGQRRVKLFWPPIFDQYQYSLYVDSNVRLKADPHQFIDLLGDESDILMFRHPRRNCLYGEARVCIKLGKGARHVIKAQVAQYREEGYPAHNGLFEAGALFRRHTPSMRSASSMWLGEVVAHSCRDQISFPYVAWKLGLHVSTFPGKFRNGPWFGYRKHNAVRSPFESFSKVEVEKKT